MLYCMYIYIHYDQEVLTYMLYAGYYEDVEITQKVFPFPISDLDFSFLPKITSPTDISRGTNSEDRRASNNEVRVTKTE